MLYTVNQLRQIEKTALLSDVTPHQTPAPTLMQAAGATTAGEAQRLLSDHPHTILVVAGPGNNGGDALEAAVYLADSAYTVHVLHHPARSAPSQDAQHALERAKNCVQLHWLDSKAALNDNYGLVIDGLFGIGLKPTLLSAGLSRQIEQINAMSCPVLALDVPSGLDADNGCLLTDAIQATHTITFIADKPGLHTGDGRDYAGQVRVASLGLSEQTFPSSDMMLNRTELFKPTLRPRRHNSHKGSFGTLAVLGGTTGMQGAVILAARAALHSGAGRVVAGFIDTPPHFDPFQPELMCRQAHNVALTADTAVVIGPGLGNAIGSFDLLSQALPSNCPLVIDADALNLMAQQPALHALCSGRGDVPTLLTPHPLEAARLLACSVADIQADRIKAARKIALRYTAVVILKGSGSIIAHPDGRVVVNPTGNPGLASAGTGDVLAGVCGALLAQYRDPWLAALAAVYYHGAAADALVAQGTGPLGLCASELLPAIRSQLNDAMSARPASCN